MAKVGEGDNRWIVTHRTDGKNVGNWHWTEKNLFPWAKKRFNELFSDVGLTLMGGESVQIHKCDSVTGDMTVMNRRGKTLFIFDLGLTLDWKRTTNDSSEVKGKIDIKELANDEDTFRVAVSLDSGCDAKLGKSIRHALLQADVKQQLQNAFDIVLEEMKENTLGIQHPVEQSPLFPASLPKSAPAPASSTTTSTTSTTSATSSTAFSSPKSPEKKATPTPSTSTTTSTKTKIKTKTVKQVLSFEASPDQLYEVFVNQAQICAFTQGPAQVGRDPGQAFILYDGAVQGEHTITEPGKRLVQKWRFKDWPEAHYSNVSMVFEEKNGRTYLTLTQSGVPVSDFERTKAGWESYYWRRIRGLFGWNYRFHES
jgi:activator of HSP90 ATPase